MYSEFPRRRFSTLQAKKALIKGLGGESVTSICVQANDAQDLISCVRSHGFQKLVTLFRCE